MIEIRRETHCLQKDNSLELLMKDICLELHLDYISDIRIKSNRMDVLSYLKKHDVFNKDKEVYVEILEYIG